MSPFILQHSADAEKARQQGVRWPGESPVLAQRAVSQKTLVGRAQWGTHPGHHRNTYTSKMEEPYLVIFCGLAWDKARLGASGLGG